ncbi:MAG: FAD:protein FMN transferase [Gammaproteobacteria bacterium]|nr:FAD:protein FMN transferase [Gammaproteobacteria bacterium]
MPSRRALRISVYGIPTLFACLALAAACAPREEVTRFQFLAFGTLVDIDVYGADRELAARAAADIETCFQALHRDWHPWGDGALGTINRAFARGETAPIDADLAGLLGEAASLSRASGGLFDPTLGRLVDLWGFSDDEQSPVAPPDAARIRALLDEGLGMQHLRIADGRIASSNPDIALDLGGFAKGVAVDRAVERLRALGVRNAIVNAGGDLRVIGRHGDRPWRIGIRHPRGKGVIAELEVHDGESVFTSGDYERYFDYQGRRYHHILDPRTGEPATGAISVTVLHRNAARADAAVTALFVAGSKAWRNVAAALGMTHVMLIGADGHIEMSPEMHERLRLVQPALDDRPRIAGDFA